MKKRVLIILTTVFGIDIITKYLIFSKVSLINGKVIINNFFKILPVKNTGAAFSFMDNNNILLILISIAILFYLIWLLRKDKTTVLSDVSYGLLIGGLLGNLYDRLFLSYVRDFLSFRIFNYDFAIFNVADIAIVIGAILLFITFIKGSKKYED